MKHIIRIICGVIIIGSFASCKKDNKGPGGNNGGSGYFFENTEWVGTAHGTSQEYDLPCYLRFNGDTTVSVYSTFNWVLSGALVFVDSVIGHVTEIDTANGAVLISVAFPLSGDQQVYSISNKNELAGGSIATSTAYVANTFSPHLQLCPKTIPSLAETSWSSKIITEAGPTSGFYAYPDLQTFKFRGDNKLEFYRAGHIITYTPTDHIQILLEEYKQDGRKIYFAGYDESRDLLNGYFGVLAADGKTILASSRSSYRLPNYVQTIYWYGPPGVTPTIYEQ